jgi:hypothetical protein
MTAEEKTDRLAKIMNRSLSQHEINKLNAMAGEPVGAVDEIKEMKRMAFEGGEEGVSVLDKDHGAVPVDDTHYIASIVQTFYSHFEKYGPTIAATLTLSACHLKASAAVALQIKDKAIYPAIPVKMANPIIPGKKRGRPCKA